MSWVDRPMGEPKHPFLTPSQRAAMSTEALRAHVYFEGQRIKREERETERRRKAMAIAQRELEARGKAA